MKNNMEKRLERLGVEKTHYDKIKEYIQKNENLPMTLFVVGLLKVADELGVDAYALEKMFQMIMDERKGGVKRNEGR